MLERIDFGPAEMQVRCSEMQRDAPKAATPCTRACNPTHGSLQPYPREPATLFTGGCYPTQAEGVAAARSFIQPVGELRQAVLEVLVARLRAVFGGLWEGEQVSQMSE